MVERAARQPRYLVHAYETGDLSDALAVSFVSNGLQQLRAPGGPSKHLPRYVVTVKASGGELHFDWGETHDDPGIGRGEMEAEAGARWKERPLWIDRIKALVNRVEAWAKEMDWATRRIEKRIDASWIGSPRVPALLLQEDTCKIILEPFGPNQAGEGHADLYLMPQYDDIARLEFVGGQWYLQAIPSVGADETAPRLLTKKILEATLEGMRLHAT